MPRTLLQTFRHAPWRALPWVRNTLIFAAPLLILFLCQLITLQDSGIALDWMNRHAQAVFLTYGMLLLCQMTLLALGRRLFPAVLALALPTVSLALASHLKESVNGIPLLASDLSMAGQAGEIAGFLRPGLDIGDGTRLALWLLLLLLAAAFCFSKGTAEKDPCRRGLAGLLSLSLLVNLALIPPSAALLAGREGETQSQRNDRLGLLAGLYSALTESAMQKPDTYNENNMYRILRTLQQSAPPVQAPTVKPNVILVLSESFFDVTELPNVTYSRDPLPNYHALARRFPAGRFLSNTYAGGTGNVEMEILTGVPAAFPGAGEDLTSLSDRSAYQRIPSVVKAFASQGYATAMVHSYTDKLYNRSHNIPALGFEKTVYQDDFTVDKTYAGGYLSDDTLADQLIAAFEQKGDNPIFLYGLSMENHQPYYTGKFDTPSGIDIETDRLDEEGLGVLEALVHGVSDADASLGKLTDYFSKCGEPTILIFLGDHLPGLPLDGSGTVYTALGYASTPNTKDWDPAEMKRMNSTQYLLWNNFGAPLTAPEELSCTGLGSGLLGWAGLPKPLYFQWVDQAMQVMKSYRERLFVAADGAPSVLPPDDCAETVGIYQSIVYDILYGQGYIAGKLTEYS